MALAHHDTAHGDQRSRRESELLRAQQSRDNHITPGLQFAVGLNDDAAAQVIHHENLLCFRKTEFPRDSRVLQRGERRGARAPVVATDQDNVGVRLRNTGRNRADTDFGDELHRNPRLRIHVLQVVDQLREILDRINVMMRRRRDQTHTRGRVPGAGDILIHLVAGNWPPSPGFAPCAILICSSSAFTR